MENFKCVTKQINEYLKNNIKCLFVSICNVVIVTKKEDHVYEFDRKSNITYLIGSRKVIVTDIEKSINEWKEDETTFELLLEKSKLNELCSKNIVEFKNGLHHMVAITVDGNIYSWGANRFGYLGNGKEQDGNICKPELIVKTSHENFENNVKEICCGYHHTLALTNEGDVFAWGWNKFGQIGNEIWNKFRRDNEDAIIPTKIKGFECDKVKAIACGAKFSLALTLNGRVFLWGHVNDDVEIRLTPEQKQSCNKPKEIIIDKNIFIEQICCGREHYLLLSTEKDIYAFGYNNSGQLGIGHVEDPSTIVKLDYSPLKFKEIGAHPEYHLSVSLASNDSCYIWGFNNFQAITLSPSARFVNEPKETIFETLEDVFVNLYQITYRNNAGPLSQFKDEFIILNHVDQIICFRKKLDPGNIFKSTLVLENYDNLSDKLNEYFKNNMRLNFVSRDLVMIVTNDDIVYEFKRRQFMHSPETFNQSELMIDIKNSIIALSQDMSTIKHLIDKSIVSELCNKNIIDLKNGWDSMFARTSDGNVYAWGRNHYGNLGIGKLSDFEVYRPRLIELKSDNMIRNKVIDICSGLHHTLALTENGDVYAWGKNDWGQIGNFIENGWKYFGPLLKLEDWYPHDNNTALIPMKVKDLLGIKIKSISCGGTFSVALSSTGDVYFWGYFEKHGLLSLDERSNCNKPKLIVFNENISIEKISCGRDHCLMLSTEKIVFAFGGNSFGQFGIGFRTDPAPLNPIQLNLPYKIDDIAAHPFHYFSAAISEKGTCYVWGEIGGKIVLNPEKVPFDSFDAIFESYFQITYKSKKGRLIKFDNEFIKDNHFEMNFNSIHRLNPRKIGFGAYGIVFKVQDPQEDIFAVKKIKFLKFEKNENMYKSFLKELGTSPVIIKLNHKNVVKYFDTWLERDKKSRILHLYIQMEFCDKTLKEEINEMNKNSYLKGEYFLTDPGFIIAIEIFMQIVEGVKYLHEQNPAIIHRDLKPANILFKIESENCHIKLGDYGLVALHEFSERSTDKFVNEVNTYAEQSHTTNVGDLDYAAPEVIEGKIYDTKADIYSLANILLDLFNIDKQKYVFLYHIESNEYRDEIKGKLLTNQMFLITLWDAMLNEIPSERPDCWEIMYNRIDSSLSEDRLKALKNFQQLLKPNEFCYNKLLENYMERTNKCTNK